MDLIIKNLDALQNYQTKSGHKPIERVVLDFNKLSEMESFTQLFFNACEQYKEEPKTGNWGIDANDPNYLRGGLSIFKCSNCNKDSIYCSDYCPNCGADMRRDEDVLSNVAKKYVEMGESFLVPNEDIKKAMKSEKTCRNCKYHALEVYEEPCQRCIESYLALDEMNPNWELKEPTLKEVTEKMQSEWDATGEDVAYFMNHRIKP